MRVKYPLIVSERLSYVMEELASVQDISRAEVIKRSVAIYDYLYKHCSSGGKVFIEKKGEKTKEIVILDKGDRKSGLIKRTL